MCSQSLEPESVLVRPNVEPLCGARVWSKSQYRQFVETECGSRVWSLKKRAERQVRDKTAEKLQRDCCDIGERQLRDSSETAEKSLT